MEQVFVVRRADFFANQWPQGFSALSSARGRDLLVAFERTGFFTDRDPAESDPSLKQLIPYCVVVRGSELFCVQRLKRQSEDRLHGLYSIGFGGHVNPGDGNGVRGRILAGGLQRELEEELEPPGQLRAGQLRLLGLLNDDATEVGRVHAGLVYELRLPQALEVRIRETDKMRGGFRPARDLRPGTPPRTAPETTARVVESQSVWQHSPAFESWSQIMLEAGPWTGPETPGEGTDRGVASREESHDG